MPAHTLDEAMERLRKNHYHLWKALCEAREDPTRLEEWRNAPPSGEPGVEERDLLGVADLHEGLTAATLPVVGRAFV